MAAANCVSVHSGRFSDHTPMRAPRSSPSARKPAASASTRSASSAHVHLTSWLGETSASRSAQRRGGPVEAAPDGIAEQRRIGDAANIAIREFSQVDLSMRQGSKLAAHRVIDPRQRDILCQ